MPPASRSAAPDRSPSNSAAAAICYVIAIRRIPISLAYPSVSVSYVAVGLAAHLLWNEPFGLPQFVGILLIGGGILLLHQ